MTRIGAGERAGGGVGVLARFLSNTGRVFDAAMDVLVASLLAAMVAVALLQVFMRYALNDALPWPEEFVRWCFLWLVFLAGAVVVRLAGHIRIDVALDALSARLRLPFDLLVGAFSGLAFGLLVTQGLEYAQTTTVISPSFHVSLQYLYLAIPVGSAFAILNLLRRPTANVPHPLWGAAVLAGVLGATFLEHLPWTMLEDYGTTTVVLVAAVVLMALGMPIAFAMVLAAFFAFWASGLPSTVVVSRLAAAVSADFILVAIPYFLFMGALMNVGGITPALVRASVTLVGHWRGGLGQVNVVTNTIMGGLSGSSSADAAAITKTLVPEMERQGYDRAYACAVTASSSLIANLLPPSISLLIFASLASVSVGALFMAGVVPGLLVGAALMVAVYVLSRTKGYAPEPGKRAPLRDVVKSIFLAAPALALPVLILGSLRAGVVTPTEAGAIAALYALVLGVLVYRTVRPRALALAFVETARDTGVILLLIAASAPMAWLLVAEGLPQTIAEGLGGIADNAILFLLLLNLFLLVVGLPLEAAPALVILVPILAPITAEAGIDPVHLGVIMVLNLMLGSLTPPVGVLAFVPAAIANVPVMRVFGALIWFQVVLVGVLLLVTFIPELSLWLPRALGF